MKDIVVVYPRENKPLVKKLVAKIESDGISCWVSPRDFKQEEKEVLANTIQQSKLMVIIVDKTSANNNELRQAISIALDNNIEIVPFAIEKVEANLYSDFFFHKLSWIDAYEDSFDDAYGLLLETYRDLTGEKKIERKRAPLKNNHQTKIKPATLAIGAVIFLLVAFIMYKVLSSDENSELLVGQWGVSDYQDNLPGHNQDSLNTIKAFLKTSAKLIFNEDRTFERRGFTQEPQKGKWELNPEKTILYLEPIGIKQKDIVNIEKLTNNELVIFVEEQVQNYKVTTKIFFSKQTD